MNSENSFKNQIKRLARGVVDQIHTALPGTVISYDSGSGRASVQPSGFFKTEDGRSLAFPVIHNAPVCFPCGGGGSIGVSFPIKPGDAGLIVFSESQLDDFLNGGDSDDPRRFALTDAMFIPGMYPAAPPVSTTDPSAVVVQNGENTAVMTSSAFTVTVGSTVFSVSGSGITGTVGGVPFSISGGDLTVAGISLVHHTHGGVEPGGGSTGQPQ